MYHSVMPKTKIITSISFITREELEAAQHKARQRGRSLSAQVREHFKNLPDLDK